VASDPESTFTITTRKSDYWKPWFGDRSHFERLAQLCETLFELQRNRLDGLVADLPDEDYRKAPASSAVKDAHVVLSIDEGTRVMAGRIAEVLPRLDFPHARDVQIRCEIPSHPFPEIKSRLLVHCVPRLGMKIDVESNDEAWGAQAYARLTEEAGRRRPWWADVKNHNFTAGMVGITGLSIWGLSVVAQLALNVGNLSLAWWSIQIIACLAIVVAYFAVGRMPVFEVHSDGGDRSEAFSYSGFSLPFPRSSSSAFWLTCLLIDSPCVLGSAGQ
jgi:hypothetical protein